MPTATHAESLQDVATRLGVGTSTVKRWRDRAFNPLPVPKGAKGRKIYVAFADLDAWLTRESEPAPTEVVNIESYARTLEIALEMIERLNAASRWTHRRYSLEETRPNPGSALVEPKKESR